MKFRCVTAGNSVEFLRARNHKQAREIVFSINRSRLKYRHRLIVKIQPDAVR